MFRNKILNYVRLKPKIIINNCKYLNTKNDNKNLPNSANFTLNDTEIIDVETDKLKYLSLLEEQETKERNRYDGIDLERGLNGVFDIDILVDILNREKAENIVVIGVPKEVIYVDYIVIVSGRSQKHMLAIGEFIRRVFKMKRFSTDQIPKLEGEKSKDWMALDLGNIVLHIFSKQARPVYDLESLWAVGSKYDDEYNKKEPVSEILDKYSAYLANLQPAS